MTKLCGSGFSGALRETLYVNLVRVVDVTDGDGGRVVLVDQWRVGIRGRRVAVNKGCGRH
jgi:hypothetical protein